MSWSLIATSASAIGQEATSGTVGDTPASVVFEDPEEPELPPVEVTPIVVDSELAPLPTYDGNPEADRPGFTPGNSSIVVVPGQGRVNPPGSAVSFEVRAGGEFPDSVKLEVETFGTQTAASASSFAAAFRVDASVEQGEPNWVDPVDVVVDFSDMPVLHGAGAANRLQLQLMEGCSLVPSPGNGGRALECESTTPLESESDATLSAVRCDCGHARSSV